MKWRAMDLKSAVCQQITIRGRITYSTNGELLSRYLSEEEHLSYVE